MLTYRQVFDKLTKAYMTTGIDPWNACFCMVGNILNNKSEWTSCRIFGPDTALKRGILSNYKNEDSFLDAVKCIKIESDNTYSPQEILDIEAVFLYYFSLNGGNPKAYSNDYPECVPTDKDEEALWIAFEKGLEFIKSIHEKRGEIIEKIPTLEKREEILIP